MDSHLPYVTRLTKVILYMHNFKISFSSHLIATSMDQQHMCVILLRVEQSAFTLASFSSLSNIHKCLGGPPKAPTSLDKQTADWLMNLVIDSIADHDTQDNRFESSCNTRWFFFNHALKCHNAFIHLILLNFSEVLVVMWLNFATRFLHCMFY